ncbi:hypothetical protein SAMN05216302_10812 [Nitrosomonas aestuarii]|uniref:ATP-binding protein n=1 Tax=Nitrosomonas aestuarii TaxID=52441 RepID=A0A1I4HF87_9PROT|nr:hypothetical protein [Nitrosomonas aestuarii]SFL40774.1 hypothetical protein SAMN05216302_10812 [Nitrosomonas aestuarii]
MIENNISDENIRNNVANVANVAGLNLEDAYDPKNEAIENALKVINETLAVCKDDPGKLLADEFLKAYEFVKKADKEKGAEIRVRIKREKPSGVLMSAIDESTSPKEGGNGDNVASELIDIVTTKGSLFYDQKTERGYITADIDGVSATMALNGKQFTEWISYQYYSTTGQSANEASIKQAKFALCGIAKYDGKQERIHLRVADHNGGHYIFLADEQLRAVAVFPTGWRIVDDPPVKFWKPGAMQALPIPEQGGDIDQLWKFINVNENDRPLVLAWILESFRSETPKPVLSLCGTQGSAKSSTQNKIRQLIDNSAVNLRAAPKSVQDIFVSAGCNWLISYENLSHLSAQIQDALCTLATGGGFASRTLYSDDDETVIDAKRPIIINSIPSVITAQDLTDRAICLELQRINYKEEVQLDKEWQAVLPSIFGGILDLFVKTIRKIPEVKLINPPRMADFTKLGEAMMQAQGKPSGAFTALYRANLNEGVSRAMESSPAAVALRELVQKSPDDGTVFHGTVQGLLQKLVEHRHDSENWPRSARGLSDVLRRQTPALALLGISVLIGSGVQRIGGERGIPVTIKSTQGGNIGNVGNVISELSVRKNNFAESVRI